MPVFERNLIAPENFDRSAGRPVELHFPNVGADLHAVGPGIHAQGAPDSAGNTDEPLHSAEVVLGTKGDHAAQVGRGVNVRKVAIDHYIGLRTNKLQDHPGQLPITHEQVRASAEELVWNMVRVEEIQKLRKAFVLLDAQQVRRPADAQRSQVGKSGAMLRFDVDLVESGHDSGITNVHEGSDAPFTAKP